MTDTRRTLLDRPAGPATCDILLRLLAIDSDNPPGDTRALAGEIAGMLAAGGVEARIVGAREPVANLVAVVRGTRPGRRLVLSGHLDTFPAGDPAAWSASQRGELRGGRIYGRGAADMKGGLAAQIAAALRLAARRDAWRGELVLAFAGDEETAGPDGTPYLLDTVPEVTGDAMLCADAGSPSVLRFGEKGFVWMTVSAIGSGGHGAHAHRATSAIDRLLEAMASLRTIAAGPTPPQPRIDAAIDAAAEASEALSGAGETEVLKRVTLNWGTLQGGTACNLVAAAAEATADIRLPAGLTVADATGRIERLLGGLPGISWRIDAAMDPTVTDPDHEIVRRAVAASTEVLGRPAVATMRVGSSDAALFRARGIPSAVAGLTPFNMGGADEYVLGDEVEALADIYALAAFDYLSAPA